MSGYELLDQLSEQFFRPAGGYFANFSSSVGSISEEIYSQQAVYFSYTLPMGSELAVKSAPRFWVWAVQDPAGPPLDRIQIVKGWVENGEQRQSVRDVVCSNGRLPGSSGKCPRTTADVNLENCERTGTEGASELQVTFSDPDFSAEQSAFYYARVLENPTCRWTTLLANSADKSLPDDLSATVQERGWSSPIWYGH